MNIPEIAECRGCNPAFAGLSPRVNTANGSQHWVFCPECGMHGPCGVGEQHAIERWNAICRQPTPEAADMGKILDAIDEVLEASVEHTCNREDFRKVLAPLLAHPPKPEATEAVAWGVTYMGELMVACVYGDEESAKIDMNERNRKSPVHREERGVIPLYRYPVAPKPPAEWMDAALDAIDEVLEASIEHTCNREDFRRALSGLHAPKVPEGGK